MTNPFNTSCLEGMNYEIKDSRNFVTITVKTPEDRESVYIQCTEFAAQQNCATERVLKQNISSIPYLLING